VDLANARGGHDNITAMIVRMKGSAATADAATLVKTMPLTAHAPVATTPPTEPAGPRGTVLTEPLRTASSPNLPVAAATASAPSATVLTAPLAAAPAALAAAIPRAPAPPPPPSERGERSKAPLVAGVVLGIVALAIVGTFVWTQERPHHVPARVVPFDASRPPSNEEDASSAAPDITLAPVLAPPSGVKVPWWKDPDASTPTGEPRECAMARWRKDAGQPPANWEALEAKCKASSR
jgi:hypothetical protein